MDTLVLALQKAATVLWVGLLFGAGLPVVFALGVRALGLGGAGTSEDVDLKPTAAGRLLGYLLFAVVLAAVALGITMIVASGLGKAVSFEHVIPTLVTKK